MPNTTSKQSVLRVLSDMIAEEATGAMDYRHLLEAIKKSFPKSSAREHLLYRIGLIYKDEIKHRRTLQTLKSFIKSKGKELT